MRCKIELESHCKLCLLCKSRHRGDPWRHKHQSIKNQFIQSAKSNDKEESWSSQLMNVHRIAAALRAQTCIVLATEKSCYGLVAGPLCIPDDICNNLFKHLTFDVCFLWENADFLLDRQLKLYCSNWTYYIFSCDIFVSEINWLLSYWNKVVSLRNMACSFKFLLSHGVQCPLTLDFFFLKNLLSSSKMDMYYDLPQSLYLKAWLNTFMFTQK